MRILSMPFCIFFLFCVNSLPAQKKEMKNSCYETLDDYGFRDSYNFHNGKFKIICGGCTGPSIGRGAYTVLDDSSVVLKYRCFKTKRYTERGKQCDVDTLRLVYDETQQSLVLIARRRTYMKESIFKQEYAAACARVKIDRIRYKSRFPNAD